MPPTENRRRDRKQDGSDGPEFSLGENLILRRLRWGSLGPRALRSMDAVADDSLVDESLALARHMQSMIADKIEIASAGAHPLVNQGMQIAKQIVADIFNEKSDEEVPPEPAPADQVPVETPPPEEVPPEEPIQTETETTTPEQIPAEEESPVEESKVPEPEIQETPPVEDTASSTPKVEIPESAPETNSTTTDENGVELDTEYNPVTEDSPPALSPQAEGNASTTSPAPNVQKAESTTSNPSEPVEDE